MRITENKNNYEFGVNDEFDFDKWSELYQQDPEAFEAMRKETINAAINQAPEDMRRRLNGLIFEIEARRNEKASPLESCMNISGMMWEKFDELRLHLNAIARPESLTEDELKAVSVKTDLAAPSATVIQFPRRS